MRSTRPDPARRIRVLIVEDEPALLRALRIDLRARGYEVATAASGQDALDQAARRPPDAVLVDLRLPDTDGTDVITRLREWSTAPVIVLSGRPGAAITIGSCVIDLTAYTVIRQTSGSGSSEAIHLTPTEWRLLEILLRSPGQLIGTSRLLAEVKGAGYEHNAHYLRFPMARLRRKLEDDPPRPRHLLTEPGMGYRYQP